MLFVIKPELSFDFIHIQVAILGAAGAALSYTMLRKLGEGTHPSVVVFFFAMFTFVSLLPFVIASYEPMTDIQLLYAILAGVCAVGGQYGVTLAYKHAQAKEVSIYNYFGVIFSAIFGLIYLQFASGRLECSWIYYYFYISGTYEKSTINY